VIHLKKILNIKKIINSIFSSCTYIIHSELSNCCSIIDCGDINPICEYVYENSLKVDNVFLTHTHFDHIYGINELYDRFPKITVYTAEYGKEALYSDKKNLSKYYEQSIIFKGKTVEILNEGNSVKLFDNTFLTAYETPGHCSSSLVYVLEEIIFTGDAFIPGKKVVTNLPKGDKMLANSSIEKIKILAMGKRIMAGHSVNMNSR